MKLKSKLCFSLALFIGLVSSITYKIPSANAAKDGPVRLCNGDPKEETIYAAIMYYSFPKSGWIAQGWYKLEPGKCAFVLNYHGGMFTAGYTSSGRVYSGTGNGFCTSTSGFYGYQKTTCRQSEKYYAGYEFHVPSSGFNFTFGNPALVRDDFR